MKYFHQYLKEGMSKNVALSKAKRTYLATSTNAEPYIWAGFIAVGDTNALGACEEVGYVRSWWWMIVFAIVLSAGILLFSVRRKRAI